jgi:REP element-mobilizing transposase RayT
MEPIYTPENTVPAYQLNWSLSVFWRAAPLDAAAWLDALTAATEPDGIRVLEHMLGDSRTSQFLLSTKPSVSPARLLRFLKGRLQHLVRDAVPKALRRNYSLRSIGAAKRSVVEEYIAGQVGHHPMADEHVQARLPEYQREFPGVDLSIPRRSAHGQYWYNLHVVLANEGRWMEIEEDVLRRLGALVERAAGKHRHALSRMAVLPDHIHLALGCPEEQSPEEIALAYMNNCAYACDMKPVLQHSYYVGTFGEYDLGAVWQSIIAPPRQARWGARAG